MPNVTSELRLAHVPTESPFVSGTNIQFAWDSVSLTTFLSCPQRYKLGIIEGWRPKNPEVAIALDFGLLLHAGLEEFHRQRTAGADYDDAVDQALWSVMQRESYANLPTSDDIEAAKEEQDENDDGINLRNAKVRTRYHLIRALVWYCEQYRYDNFETVILANGLPAVEYSARVPTGRSLSDGTELMLSGHFDRLVLLNDEPFIKDYKTTKSISKQYKQGFDLSHQMTGYTLLGHVALEVPVKGVFIDAIALQVGGVQFERFPTWRSKNQLTEYLATLEWCGEMAERYYEADFYPLNTSACFFCEFKDVCRVDPKLRHGILNYHYERKPAWNPLEVR